MLSTAENPHRLLIVPVEYANFLSRRFDLREAINNVESSRPDAARVKVYFEWI